jgi:mannose-6-phosphate isomerase-like protein (cupin superfamily)
MLASLDRYRTRSYAQPDFAQPFEFCEISIAPDHREQVPPFPFGARATLLLTLGTMEIAIGDEPAAQLTDGAAILFQADVKHSFFNPGAIDATAFLIVAPPRNGSA